MKRVKMLEDFKLGIQCLYEGDTVTLTDEQAKIVLDAGMAEDPETGEEPKPRITGAFSINPDNIVTEVSSK